MLCTNIIFKAFSSSRLSLSPVVRRSFRKSLKENIPLWEDQLSSRLHLLKRPLAITILVTGTTYILSQKYKLSDLEIAQAVTRRYLYKMSSNINKDFDIELWWHSQLPGTKLVYSIIAANCAVFLLWNVGAAVPFLNRFFVCNVYGSAPTMSMLGSVFSHVSFFHLAANMYVLRSLSDVIADPLHLAHIYLTGGVVATFCSYLRNVIVPRPPFSGLGASGAILALIGYTIAKFPEARFSIALIDQIYPHSFTARQALIGIATFDTCGLIFGWKIFDHAAHLGGLLFGLFRRYIEDRPSKT